MQLNELSKELIIEGTYTYSYELSIQGKEWFIQGNNLFKYRNKKKNIFIWVFMKGNNLFMQGHELFIYKELSDSYIQRNDIFTGLLHRGERAIHARKWAIHTRKRNIHILGVQNERNWDIQ